jgi:hypothetical protein
MSDTSNDIPPDRLAVDPRSEFYDAELLARGIGINFRGERKRSVEEYCISEGWVKVQAGKTMDRRGRPLLIKMTGPVEAWFEDLGDDAAVAKREEPGA